MVKKTLRVLIIDDSPDDAEIAVSTLRQQGYTLKIQRVQDLPGIHSVLEKNPWDAVLCEFLLAHFGAEQALNLVKRAGRDLPFIVLTHTIADADLIKVMRAGAHDVVLKNQMPRLVSALERELRAADDRHAARLATQKLKEIEKKHRAMIEGSRDAIGYILDGMHVDANQAYLDLFGYQHLSDLEGVPVMNLFDRGDHARFKELVRKAGQPDWIQVIEFVGIKKNDDRIDIEVSLSPVTIDGEECTQIVVVDISERKAARSKLQFLDRHDALTGLYNRHHFIQELENAVEHAKQDQEASGLIYIDLDGFGAINDTYGYAAGDRLLVKVAQLLQETLGSEALVSRFGNDEFVTLSREDDKSLKNKAAALQNTLRQSSFTEGGQTFHCQCALGLTLINHNTESSQEALSLARQAGAQGKLSKSQSPSTDREGKPAAPTAKADPNWEQRLTAALETNGFQLIYQPIMNLHGEAAEYFEVLVRMTDEHGKLISAAEFMPAVREYGKSVEIDRWVVRHAIDALDGLHREGRRATFFINLCPTAFDDSGLIDLIGQELSKAQLAPEHLVFEADETAIGARLGDAKRFADAISKLGCRFAIDNFGVGRNAVEHLRELPFEFLKIDGALSRNLTKDNVNKTSLQAIVDVAKAMNKRTIAKSVEAADNLAVLWNLGVDYVQGSYFQQIDTEDNNDFGSEATVSSDSAVPRWAHTPGET